MRFALIAGNLAACGMVLALAPEAQARPGQDWTKVESLEATRHVRIVLHDKTAAEGRRKFAGMFSSATSDSLTLLLASSKTRTFRRDDLCRVSVKVGVRHRHKAWGLIVLAAFAGPIFDIFVWNRSSGSSNDLLGVWTTPRFWQDVGITAIPTAIIAMAKLDYRPIYAKPRR
ncbi:MAG: hypothetical protein OXD30_02665 [Bryobacterales bacterium]|nr:hypothetical protein [Bryobacterales bacterium]